MTTQVRVLDVGRVVPEARSSRPSAVEPRRCSRDRSRSQPEISSGRRQEEDLGEAAHADAAGSDEMEPPQPQEPHRPRLSASKRRSARRLGGVRPRERPRVLCPSATSRARSPRSSRDGAASDVLAGQRRFSSITTRRPRLDETRGRSRSGGRAAAEPNGTRIDGPPGGRELRERQRAGARRATRSAQASSSWIRGRNGTSLQPAGSSAVALARARRTPSRPVWWIDLEARLLQRGRRAASTIARFRTARALAAAEDEQAPRRRGRVERRDREELGTHGRPGDDAGPARGARWPRRARRPSGVAKRLRKRLATPGKRVGLVDRASGCRASAPRRGPARVT